MEAPPDPSLGSLITTVLHILSLALFVGRMYDRIVPTRRISWDGYTLIAAVVHGSPHP